MIDHRSYVTFANDFYYAKCLSSLSKQYYQAITPVSDDLPAVTTQTQ